MTKRGSNNGSDTNKKRNKNHTQDGQVFERVRGRPRGHNRAPLSREEQRARNAFYERERRAELADGWKKLGEAMKSNKPQKILMVEAAPFVKKLEHKMLCYHEKRQQLKSLNAALRTKLKALQASANLETTEVNFTMEITAESPTMIMDSERMQLDVDSDSRVPNRESENILDLLLPAKEKGVGSYDVLPDDDDVDGLHLSTEKCGPIDLRPKDIDVVSLVCSAESYEKDDTDSPRSNISGPNGVNDDVDSGVHSPEIQDIVQLSEEEHTYLDSWARMDILETPEAPVVDTDYHATILPLSSDYFSCLSQQDKRELENFDRLVELYSSKSTT